MDVANCQLCGCEFPASFRHCIPRTLHRNNLSSGIASCAICCARVDMYASKATAGIDTARVRLA